MKNAFILLFSILITVSASVAAAAELYVYVFDQEGLPAPDVAIRLNGDVQSATDAAGAAQLPLQAGKHALVLRKGRILLADTVFTTTEEQEAEITVRLARAAEPEISIVLIDADDRDAPGTLAGYVTSATTGMPLAGAQIALEGTAITAMSDNGGTFTLELPRGSYTLRVSHPGAGERVFDGVRIIADATTEFDFRLGVPASSEAGPVEEVVATARYVPDTIAVAERSSESVLEAISDQEISIAGDSTAAAALRRVTGLTIVDDKYVYVRGLGERYSSTLLNGAELPSPDPTRRVVPLDIFPTEMLDGILIQKTYSPEMPGDFSGGVVRLKTRGVPAGYGGKISFSLGGNSETTFQDGFTYDGGDRDFLGLDDGTRDIPAVALNLTDGGTLNLNQLTPEDREAVAESLPNNWDVRAEKAPLDAGLEFSIGDRLDTEDSSYGYQAAFIYSNEWRTREEDRAVLALGSGDEVFAAASSTLDRTEQAIGLGGMLNFAAEIGADHTLNSTTLLTRKTTNSVFIEQGTITSANREVRDTTLEWVETQLLSQQFSGKHSFSALDELELDWHATFSSAERDQPDKREYRYARNFVPGQPRPDFQLAATTSLGRRAAQRTWEFLEDDAQDVGVAAKLPFRLNETIMLDLHGGLAFTARDRDFSIVRWRYDLPSPAPADLADDLSLPSVEDILTPDTIGPGQWQLFNANLQSDTYTAEQDVSAIYLSADLWLGSNLRLKFGARREDSEIAVTTSQLFDPSQLSVSRLDTSDTLPAVNVTWYLSDAAQLRFGASQTVNRPQFRELSPVPFTDPETRYTRVGNPNLKQAEIVNLDVRYEYYWSDNEVLTVAGFYKDFENPIEQVIVGGGSEGLGVRTFDNVAAAKNYGLEFEFRDELDEFSHWSSLFEHMYLSTNLALIESQVSITPAQAAVLTSTERELQGQSPWVFNLQIGYDNLGTLTQAALLFNVFGERIVEVGQKGVPDAVEQPTPTLDFALSKGFISGWTVKFKARNLLDATYEVKQGSGTQREYNKGISASLGVEYAF